MDMGEREQAFYGFYGRRYRPNRPREPVGPVHIEKAGSLRSGMTWRHGKKRERFKGKSHSGPDPKGLLEMHELDAQG